MKVRVTGVALAAPGHVETAAELAPRIGRSERWIVTRAGVSERRVADLPMEQMAALAVRAALGDGPPPDLLINASLTPVQLIPDSSVFIQQELGWSGLGIPSWSVHATCLSFVVALQQAAALVSAGVYRRVVVVSAETGTRNRDFEEPESAALIGDGAGAALVEPTPDGQDSALLGFEMSTWPDGASLAEIRGCGTRRFPLDPATERGDYLFHMNGPALYRNLFEKVDQLIERLVSRAGLRRQDVDLVVPHQASGPALASLERLGFAPERTVSVIHLYGNCIAASIPMALAHAVGEGRINRGQTVLLIGTGAGLSAAGALLRW